MIVGAVHVAQGLPRMAAICGYDVTVTDPRGAFASEEDYAQAQEAWAEATNFGNDAGADKATAGAAK